MGGEIDVALREEIVECQKAKAEFIRWKLIIIAAVGAGAVGLEKTGQPALFALIPLVCIYVDSMCLHNDSRILMIGAFLRTGTHVSAEAKEYEAYCARNRLLFYSESFVLFVTSIALSVFVAAWGVYTLIAGERWVGAACLFSGVVGLAAAIRLLQNFYLVQEGKAPWQFAPPRSPEGKTA